MVKFIKRDKKDIFSWPLINQLFKNRYLLLLIRLCVATLFFSAIYFGFIYPNKTDNPYTTALFWSLFWPFFMILTLPTLGPVFCGICPHGFIGKYINKFGLKKRMPDMLKNPYISLSILLGSYWFIVYTFPKILKTPYASAIFFSTLTFIAFILFFLYKQMSYCKYICPIGPLTKAFGKVSFSWLGTYKNSCLECKSFECSSACAYHLQPFKFNDKNSMDDCTLCMDCAHACEAVKFEIRKPSSSLLKDIKKPRAIDIWVYILLIGAVTFTMQFHHSLGRTAIADKLPWHKVGVLLADSFNISGIDWIGLSAYFMGIVSSIFLSLSGLYLASKLLKIPFKEGFVLLGYGLAPLMIIGAMHHIFSFFFYHYASNLLESYYWLIGNSKAVIPLATREDRWVNIFAVFSYLGVFYSLWIVYARVRLTNASSWRKVAAWLFSSITIFFYLALLIFNIYVFSTYGVKMHH